MTVSFSGLGLFVLLGVAALLDGERGPGLAVGGGGDRVACHDRAGRAGMSAIITEEEFEEGVRHLAEARDPDGKPVPLRPKPVGRCVSAGPDGERCDLFLGHDGLHEHDAGKVPGGGPGPLSRDSRHIIVTWP